jgi:hypothetical protein
MEASFSHDARSLWEREKKGHEEGANERSAGTTASVHIQKEGEEQIRFCAPKGESFHVKKDTNFFFLRGSLTL